MEEVREKIIIRLDDIGFHEVDAPTIRDLKKQLDGCRFNAEGVQCYNRDNCENCGWNPRIERQRKWKIRGDRHG